MKRTEQVFTHEFALAAVKAYKAVEHLCDIAGATHTVTVSGREMQIGDRYNGRMISVVVDDALIEIAFPSSSP